MMANNKIIGVKLLECYKTLTVTLTNLFLARSAMDFHAVFPERVRGNPVTTAATWKAAMGPINSLTISLIILDSVFIVPDGTDIKTQD